MTPCIRISAITALIASLALPAWGQQYQLYAPQPLQSGQKPSAQDGVVVQEIEIQKGDTLYGLSRKFSGKGMYYPQILLFNEIKNPNLIYPGKKLKVPVSNDASSAERVETKPSAAAPKTRSAAVEKKSATKSEPSSARQTGATAPASTASTELSLSDLKATAPGKGAASRHKKKAASHSKKIAAPEPSSTAAVAATPEAAPALIVAPDTATGQKLFEAAVKAYRKDDCKTALELLDRYLADNSGSPLAADATLYKAECYLKLSAQ
jgi:LysM repeat protein